MRCKLLSKEEKKRRKLQSQQRPVEPGGTQSLVWFGFQRGHSTEVNEQYFIRCHMLPLQQDYIFLCPPCLTALQRREGRAAAESFRHYTHD